MRSLLYKNIETIEAEIGEILRFVKNILKAEILLETFFA